MAALKHNKHGAYWDRYASDVVFFGPIGLQCYQLACTAYATDKNCPFHELPAESFMGSIGVDFNFGRGGRWGGWLMHNPLREYRHEPLYSDVMLRSALADLCIEQCADERGLQSTLSQLTEIVPELESDFRQAATERYRCLVFRGTVPA